MTASLITLDPIIIEYIFEPNSEALRNQCFRRLQGDSDNGGPTKVPPTTWKLQMCYKMALYYQTFLFLVNDCITQRTVRELRT